MSPIYSLIRKIMAYEEEQGWYDLDSPGIFVFVTTIEYFQPCYRPSLSKRLCSGCTAYRRFMPMSTLWLPQFTSIGHLPQRVLSRVNEVKV